MQNKIIKCKIKDMHGKNIGASILMIFDALDQKVNYINIFSCSLFFLLHVNLQLQGSTK